MMGAIYPTRPMEPALPRYPTAAETYVRLEWGETDPAWLMAEARAFNSESRRWGTVFRTIIGRVAAFLF